MLLLHVISKVGDAYGYAIIKELRKRSNGYFRFTEGTLYPNLHKLEQAGLVNGEWRKTKNGLERRYYRITAKGQEKLLGKIKVWEAFTGAMNLIIGSQSAGEAL